ncbi:pentapeptide repeat-containing protein [Aeromicrobium sp. UC242_57]|uniref:pentapeptide repeat-containing protein n=1 Tax=Aeromicrobium sp. UC242_57 TaxID=3374624 RepID=UPI00378F8FF4
MFEEQTSERADLRGADLTGARMDGADIRGALVHEANGLTPEMIAGCSHTESLVKGQLDDATAEFYADWRGDYGDETYYHPIHHWS